MKGTSTTPTVRKTAWHLHDVSRSVQTAGNVLFYLAVADRFFGPIIENLGHAGCSMRNCGMSNRSAGGGW